MLFLKALKGEGKMSLVRLTINTEEIEFVEHVLDEIRMKVVIPVGHAEISNDLNVARLRVKDWRQECTGKPAVLKGPIWKAK